jgi:hypothetical protein
MQPKKYRRRKRRLMYWERASQKGDRYHERLYGNVDLADHFPWWERLICWILRV